MYSLFYLLVKYGKSIKNRNIIRNIQNWRTLPPYTFRQNKCDCDLSEGLVHAKDSLIAYLNFATLRHVRNVMILNFILKVLNRRLDGGRSTMI